MVSTGFATLNSSGFTAGPPPEKSLQLFTYSQAYQGIQLQAINLDLVASSGGPFYLDQQLPPMLLSNGDFTATASFFDQFGFFFHYPTNSANFDFNNYPDYLPVETLNLNIEAVNEAPVPLPPAIILLAPGLLGLTALRSRFRR